MMRLAVIFESSPFDRKGIFNAVHNRVKHLLATGECTIDVFCVHSRDNAFTRRIRHTPHQHYLAKSFILLADVYIQKERYFEAKQYLLSLKDNYVADDKEISDAIASRLELINKKESETVSNQ